jgi:hypothetical protein
VVSFEWGSSKVLVAATPNVREFLARVLPWPQEGEPATFVNVHYGVPIKDKATGLPEMRNGKPLVVFPGRACRSVDEAARTIEWANTLNTDIYICMSAQDRAEEKVSAKGRPYLKAMRQMDYAARLKSLYVDVDVKPEDPKHGYADQQEAFAEFGRILRELSLPRPSVVVRSGSGGFHAHWTFVEPIAPDRWRKLSSALAAALLSKGFRGDTQCIVDVVRLLRPPGTWNRKGGQAKAVTLLGNIGGDVFIETLEQALEPYVGFYQTPAAKPRLSALGAPSSLFAGIALPPLDAGYERDAPSIDEIAGGCPFIARTLATGGAGNNNPVWLQTTNVALFAKDSRQAAHRMSMGHPTYNALETDNLFDRQVDTKRQRDLGWPRCATIASYGVPECTGCPHLAQGQSPLKYAMRTLAPSAQHLHGSQSGVAPSPTAPTPPQTTAVAPALAPLPTGYVYDPANRICMVETDDQGNQTTSKPICSFLMEKPWLQQDPPVLNFTTHTHVGHERQIRVPYEMIVDKSGFAKGLAKQGMLVGLSEMRQLGDFFVAWIDKMRADRSNVVQSQPFGWYVPNGKVKGFVYAGHVWSADVPRPAANSDPVLASQYAPTGELSAWLTASKMITQQQRPPLNAMLAVAFAAPLVRFTGQTGLLMSTYSTHSGIGKSTVMKVAQAVWGHPQKAVQSLSDTQNAVLKKIGDTKNLPLFWDELKTKEDTQKFVNLAFQLSQGKEKSRLAADTSYREAGTWQTMLCATSNSSLLAHVLEQTKTTSAGLYRVFEFDVPPGVTGQMLPSEAQLITAALNENYGAAGLAYAQFLGEHHERVSKEVAALTAKLEKQYAVQADERFWLALIATIISGARFSNELKLTEIDVPQLARFMLSQLAAMRQRRIMTTVDINVSVNVISILSRYMNEHRRRHTVITNIIHRGGGRPPAWQPGVGSQTPGVVTSTTQEQAVQSVRIQIGKDDSWVRIIKAPFDDWLREQELTPALIHRELWSQLGVQELRAKLCAGTLFSTAVEPCLEFNFADPRFQNMIEI